MQLPGRTDDYRMVGYCLMYMHMKCSDMRLVHVARVTTSLSLFSL